MSDPIVRLDNIFGLFDLKPPTYHGQYVRFFGVPVVVDQTVPRGTIEVRDQDGKVLTRVYNISDDVAEIAEG